MPAQDAMAPNPMDTPAQELEKIRQLLALHRRNEAVLRLAAFQKAHPDIALPDDLRALLPDHE
jgi:Meckel syndrome type 1 protein